MSSESREVSLLWSPLQGKIGDRLFPCKVLFCSTVCGRGRGIQCRLWAWQELGGHSSYRGVYQERCVPYKTSPLPPHHPIPTRAHSVTPLQEPCLTKDRVILMEEGRGRECLLICYMGNSKRLAKDLPTVSRQILSKL